MNDLERAVAKARISLAKAPFWGRLVMALDVRGVKSHKIPTAAVSSKGRLLVNPEWFLNLDEEERKFVIAHEAYHLAMRHMARRGSRHPILWNMATDYATNIALLDSGPSVGSPPKQHLYDPQFRGMAPEDIYEVLRKKYDSDEEPETTGNFDVHSKAEPSKDIQREWRQVLSSAISQVRASRSYLPDSVEVEVEQETKSLVNWRNLLSNFINSIDQGGLSWTRPNRRSESYAPIIMPGQYRSVIRDLVLVWDTSGSISKAQLERATSSIMDVLQSSTVKDLWLLQVDDAVRSWQHFESIPDISGIRILGRGGTSFQPAFEFVTQNHIQPAALIYITDCDGPFPDQQPDYPVVWLRWQVYYAKDPPFGTVIDIPLP